MNPTLPEIEVDPADLPFHCPPPGDSLWDAHPRIYLPLEIHGEARCPYCGTRYHVKPGHDTAKQH